MRIIIILFLSLLTFTGYAQKRQNIDQLVVKDSLTIKAGNPAANKIAVSVDGNGRFRWVYFSAFQDTTVNYDTTNVNALNANTVKVNRDSFTDPAATIASIGDSGFIVQCFTCDTIQQIINSLYKDTLVSGVVTAGAFTMPNLFGSVIFTGVGVASTYTFTLPSNPINGQKILITTSGVGITLLSFNGNGNLLGVTLTAGINMSSVIQRYVVFHNGTWY